MIAGTNTYPSWVGRVLAWPGLWPLVRLALVSSYVLGGFEKLLDFDGAIREQEHFGLYPGALWAALSIVVELAGSAGVIWNRMAWLGAGALSVLTAVAMGVANDFWNQSGHDRFVALNTFFEHLGLIAAFVMIVWLSGHKPNAKKPLR